jgi:gluconolactonase
MTHTRLLGRGFTALCAALWLSSCDTSSGPRDQPNVGDAARDPVTDAGATGGADAGRDAGNAATATDAAQTDEPEGGSTTARDGGAALGDAGTGTPTPSLRAQICGDATSWPAPASQPRAAQRVGTASFGFVEGPVWIAELGVLLFSDMNFAGGDAKGPPSRIHRLTPPATFDVLVQEANSNGLALTPDGKVLAATHDTQSLSLFDPATGARTKLDIQFEGKHFSSPNDLTVRSDGTVYFTDPAWQLGSRKQEIDATGVYRVAPPLAETTAKQASSVDATLPKPNGIRLSPDERTLYVGSSAKEVWKFPVQADGSLGARSMFAKVDGGSDGMTVDCAGNVYVVAGTVKVFDPSGNKLYEITTSESPSNVAFGGANHKTLYITASTGLYALELDVPGFPY